MTSIGLPIRATLAFSLTVSLLSAHTTAQTTSTVGEPLISPAQRVLPAAFTLTDVNGKPLSLGQYRGRVILLDFWGISCGGCKLELPWYVDFDHKYRQQGLSLVGIDMYGDTPAAIKPFMTKQHMNYPVAVGTDALGGKFGITSMPVTLLIDRQGRIAFSHTGVVDRASFETHIQELLRE